MSQRNAANAKRLTEHLRDAYNEGRESHFFITDMFPDYVSDVIGGMIGNGCQHGFKPAKDCPNQDCTDAMVHYAMEVLQGK